MALNMQINSQASSGQGLVSAQQSRLNALKEKHAALSKKVDEERKHSFQSESLIARLKKEKLLIKQEIEQLSQAS